MGPNEETLKKMATERRHGLVGAQNAFQAQQGAQPSLREGFQNQLYRAERDAAKALKLGELVELLDKHPEVARILELINEVGQ